MNPKYKVLISTSSFAQADRKPLELLTAAGVDYQLNPHGRQLKADESIALLSGMDGVLAGTEKLDQSVLPKATGLKVISRCGVGLDSVDLKAAAELGIRVYNTPEAHVDAVAELTLAGMLDVLRHVSATDQKIRRGEWHKPLGNLLRGKTIGIVGLGRTGKALVKLLQPFAVTVLAYDPNQDAEFAPKYQVTYLELNDLLPRVDIVSLHLPYSKEIHHLLDETRLGLMKTGAIVINCARGGLIDEASLADRLKDGRLAGAYLDVFEQEPYKGPLLELSNVVLTAHIGSYAAEARVRMEVEAVENLLRGFSELGI
jgi:D-3-phosphoglycerate dehydrogenase